MTLISHDERLIKALAVAIVDHPRATLKELAEAAGVSKATLHRFCGTRDNLVQMLEGHGETVLNQIIQACDLEHAEPLEALQRLIKEHLTHRELLVFLVFQYRPDFLDPHGEGARWQSYLEALDAFFLRGQQKGVFRIDVLKIDRSFVDGLPHGEQDAQIARAIIAMAHSLNLMVIAEGVESQAQLDFLREHGCDEVQGYLFGRPMPAEQFGMLYASDVLFMFNEG